MITRSEMFTPLLEADPSFQERWQRFLADYADEPEPLIYVALGELAEHLVESVRAGDVDRFARVFETVERWHTEGDAYVSEAASIGLLESLQGIWAVMIEPGPLMELRPLTSNLISGQRRKSGGISWIVFGRVMTPL